MNSGADGGCIGDSGRDLLQFCQVSRDQADMDSLPREFGRDCRADATTGTCDQRDLSVQPEFHEIPPTPLAAMLAIIATGGKLSKCARVPGILCSSEEESVTLFGPSVVADYVPQRTPSRIHFQMVR